MKKLSEYLLLWALGGSFYYAFEVFFRGFSHWSMFVLGGFCLIFCAQQGIWTHWSAPLWKMHWNVWDYTGMPFQFMGQICLPFAVIFSGLCAAGILMSGYLLHFLYGEESPHFHVL